MSLQLRFHSPAPPETVLAAIHERAGEWRQSRIPEALQKQGLRRVAAEVSGDGFVLSMPTLSDTDDVQLRGRVLGGRGGGSTILATCGDPHSLTPAKWLSLLGVGLVLAGRYGSGALLLFLALVAVFGTAMTELRIERRDHATARFLTARLEGVLAGLDPAESPVSP